MTFLNFITTHHTLEFDIKDKKTSVVNAIRRTCLNDIENIGFESKNCIVKKNTTNLNDEFLTHRISLVPVLLSDYLNNKIDISKYKFILNVSYESQKKHKGHVTTNDFKLVKIEDNVENVMSTDKVFVKDPDPVLITRFPTVTDKSDKPELHIECTLSKGTPEKNALFSPVSIVTAFASSKTTHHFKIESLGLRDPREIVEQSMKNIILKLNSINQKLNLGTKYDGNFDAVDFPLHNYDHTIGNMLQEFIYNREFESEEKTKLTHISYHQTHPLERKIILRVALAEKKTDFDDYKGTAIAVINKHIESLVKEIRVMLCEFQEVK